MRFHSYYNFKSLTAYKTFFILTDIAQMDESGGGRICRFVTYDFPQYFAVISRIHQEVHAIGPEGGMVSSLVVPQVNIKNEDFMN